MSQYKEAIKIANKKGYYVDKNGNVFYKNKIRKCQIRKFKPNIKYYFFNIRNNNKIMSVKVHQFQAYQKYGNDIFKENIVIRHLNGNSLDNSYENIAIG